ncbi:MAG: hypothetical protein ACN4A7_04570 [Thermacetogeniaceae bacterium]|jgi:hypothetical protein|nr:hypothetical protein [Thermoanaerobacterales bacterium]NLN21433.1 DUF2283 domain-containing protein [Syntrophomonadaceae bacterium]
MYPENSKTNVVINYDKKNDILYVSFGPPRPSYSVAEIDDVFIMKDIVTQEYSGLKILDFLERLNDGSLRDLNLPFCFDFEELEREFKRNCNCNSNN